MGYFELSPEELLEFTDFMERDIENVRRVVETVEEAGIDAEFMVHEKAETVQESAENTDVEKGDIVKTLVFIADEPVAVLCSGDSRVDEDKLSEVVGEKVRMASPDEVEDSTSYVIGGVSPFDLDIPVYMEEGILESEFVKPAAGSRVVGVELRSSDLEEITGAEVVDVT